MFLSAVIGSLISEYPGYSLISDCDSARDCFSMIWFFLKGLFLTDSLVGYMLTLLFTSVSVKAQDIYLAAIAASRLGEYSGLFTSTSMNNYSPVTSTSGVNC